MVSVNKGGCGFVREENEYRPVYEIMPKEGQEPSKVLYLKSPTKLYRYELVEVKTND